jgi:hypothetical protein
MADPPVKPTQCWVLSEELVEIHLRHANKEDDRADHEEGRTCEPDSLEQEPRRRDHVRQEECCEPARGWRLSKEQEHRIERRIEKRGEGADHDQHLKCNNEVQDYYAAKEAAQSIHGRSI